MNTQGSMQTVDLADWRFTFDSDPRFIGTQLEEPQETFEFSTAIELLQYLAQDDTRQSAFQNRIQKRLTADPIAKEWHKPTAGSTSSKPRSDRDPVGLDRTDDAYASTPQLARRPKSLFARSCRSGSGKWANNF